MSRYARQFAAAASAYDNASPDDDHGRKPTGPGDCGDLYADGWTIGKGRQPVISVAEANRRYREYLAGVSK